MSSFRPLVREEVDVLVDWAAAEGWNPGQDADAFWATDPDGFVGLDLDGQLAGGGAVIDYGTLGFMGLFIVKPEHRGAGIGHRLWYYRRDLLLERLPPGAPLAMDGVKAMEPFYAAGGFRTAHDQHRMRLVAVHDRVDPHVRELSGPVGSVGQYDARCFGASRPRFLRPWLIQEDHYAVAYLDDRLRGYAVIRPCRSGYKVGPLFADDVGYAQALLGALMAHVPPGCEVFIDVPDVNAPAMRWAAELGGQEVFSCARMYYGRPPATDWSRVFGVTTLELG